MNKLGASIILAIGLVVAAPTSNVYADPISECEAVTASIQADINSLLQIPKRTPEQKAQLQILKKQLRTQDGKCRNLIKEKKKLCAEKKKDVKSAEKSVKSLVKKQAKLDRRVLQAARKKSSVSRKYDNKMARQKQLQDQYLIKKGISCVLGFFGGGDLDACSSLEDRIMKIQLKMGDIQKSRDNAVSQQDLKIGRLTDDLANVVVESSIAAVALDNAKNSTLAVGCSL